ncbi:MAG: histidinol phosphate phosphatase domain-containing protein [Endomicrobiaceae bacterium]|nr:histidinol phosphate phosphatase domain-containing protein [Endomicrobiaceae bacterium]MDD3053814.1 histidinol phosphate phosphatase domain-containing protein [Endomicrobiaceae bacterium]MDD3922627.1 histidinol phosphate phosphatase domain-containing protein [Endomicrobiaceae bacterium]MDD5101960.1 histidinol phosphate phosphatase domain-containing protein [Endomicrobiaceae bacterium]
MIDLHTHTLFSDGVLLPSELVYRAKFKGYKIIAITDHVDYSTYDYVIPRILKVADVLQNNYDIQVIAGVEITYVPPKLIKDMVSRCRQLGSQLIVVHGETVAETVPEGTNHYAVQAGIDILAHPGHIKKEDVLLAKENNVCLEITTRNGHNATNKEVATLTLECGAKFVFDTDSHSPEDLMDKTKIEKTLANAGLDLKYFDIMQQNALDIIKIRGLR